MATSTTDPTTAETNRNGATELVRTLQQAGVEEIFGLPGVHNLAIWSAALAESMRVVGVRHEQSAVYAADGAARTTGKLGVAVTTRRTTASCAAFAMAGEGTETQTGSGFSAETTIIDASWVAEGDARSSKFVLRKETPDPPVYPTQVPGMTVEVDLQYRVMEAVSRSSEVPIAPLIGYEAAAKIAKHAVAEGITVREAVIALGYVERGELTEAQLDEKLDLLSMTHPG